ncbi:nucleotidyltransferase domain-containing protein [bacterium]|nr:nucleotidyltransferase domain-containing protein [bacterium]
MVDPEIKRIVLQYISVLIKKGIRIDKVILFGSYASGNIHEVSDIDIAIISSDFGKDRYEEGKMLFQAAWRIDPRLEPLPISTHAYKNDTWLPIIYEIREKGIEIKAA